MNRHIIPFIVILIVMLVGTVSADYILQVEALTNSPADGGTVYFGNNPSAPTTTIGINPVQIPVAGTITTAEIYDYSGTAGTAEVYQYFILINNQTSYRIANVSAAAKERIFSNTSMGITVNAGDYFEIKRIHPTWATNPLTNIVGGYIKIETTTPGYALWGQALTHSEGNNTLTYFGVRPIAPTTAAQTNKIYIPAEGSITKVYIRDYAGTGGSSNESGYYLERNGGAETPIMNLSVGTNLRLYNNTNLNLNVEPGDFIEFKRKNPQYQINPLTNIIGASAFVSTAGSPTGYPVWFQALTSSPTDAQTIYLGNRPIAPSTTAATNKVYFRSAGTIKRIEMYCYSGTAGTAEPWSVYLRKNNTEDFLISTNNISANERLFKNLNVSISVASGDYFEIKGVQPTWATNPATTIYGGYLWFEYSAGSSGSSSGNGDYHSAYTGITLSDVVTLGFLGICGMLVVAVIGRKG